VYFLLKLKKKTPPKFTLDQHSPDTFKKNKKKFPYEEQYENQSSSVVSITVVANLNCFILTQQNETVAGKKTKGIDELYSTHF